MLRIILLIAASALPMSVSHGSEYPARPIKIVVPFPPGGPTDTTARLLAQPLGEALSTTVVVENMGGAGGTLGSAFVAKSTPDGYTLLLHHIGLATAAALYPKLPYNTKIAFTPIGLVNELPLTVIGRTSLPYTSGQDLIAALKKDASKFNVAYAGVGSASHLCAVLIMQAMTVQLNLVPYKGTAPAINDILGQSVDLVCDSPSAATKGMSDTGKLKVFLTPSSHRLSIMPSVPTAAEAGAGNLELAIWNGFYAPAGTPKEVVDRLVAALQIALKDPRVSDRFMDLNIQSVGIEQQTPAALDSKLNSEIDRWSSMFRSLGISLE